MTQRYSNNGNGYVPNQSFGHRQPTTFTPAPPTGLAQTNFSTAQALPPLSASNYPNAVGNDPFMPSRTQPQQSTSLAGPAASSQPGTFPVYPPTASTHYASHNGLPTHPPLMQTSQISNAQATNGQARPAYTSSAPPNIQLPKIQPAPMANGDFKHAYLPEKKGMQLLASAPLSIGQDVPLKHVVGSQGRRGVLPSAAGRPPAVNNSNTTGGKNSPALAKDNDGKYPCPHCSKPYLHAKHLKRHMLRHTGVRPYECALCHDTFSRSDILKRHFQKCSVRRGNPTGENHLAYSRANKKAKQSEEESIAAGIDSMTTEQVASLPSYSASLDSPIGLAGMGIDQPNYPDRQEPLANQVTRSNGMRKVSGLGNSSNRNSASSLSASVFDTPNVTFSTGHVTPDSVTTSGAATPYTYPHEARSSLNSPADATFGHSMGLGLGAPRLPAGQTYAHGSLPHIVGQPNGRTQDLDWSAFQPYTSNNDDFSNAQYHSGTNTPHHNYKQDADFPNAFDWSLAQAKQ